MTVVTPRVSTPSTPELRRPAQSAPVILWAIIGALSTALILYGWTRWITSDDFAPTPHGPDELSDGRLVILRAVEVASIAGALAIIAIYLVRPLVRDRRLNLDGMMIIALMLAWFYDPLANYLSYSFAYNNHAWNYGSWVRFIPGWETPGAPGNFVEPIWVAGAWVWWCFGGAVLFCHVLRRMKARRAHWSTLRLFTVLAIVLVVLDLIAESLFLRTQVFAWPGTPHSLTLWPGHYYQFPLLESLFVIMLMYGITVVRFFTDDHGRSFVERGVDQLNVSERMRPIISMLAVTGFLHVVVVVGYNLPVQIMAVKSDTFPPMPSYLRSQVCGEGTPYACPSGSVPVPGRGSLHIAPDDPRLPADVRSSQGIER